MAVAIAASVAMAASASTLTWGSYGSVTDWDGNASTSPYALVYLLTDAGAPTYNAETGTWDTKGATLVGMGAYDADLGGWGDAIGQNVSAVNSGTTPDAEQQNFAIFLTSSQVADITEVTGAGMHYAMVSGIVAEQFVDDPMGPTYGTNVYSFDDVEQSSWSTTEAVPEPTSIALLALGLAALGLKRKIA